KVVVARVDCRRLILDRDQLIIVCHHWPFLRSSYFLPSRITTQEPRAGSHVASGYFSGFGGWLGTGAAPGAGVAPAGAGATAPPVMPSLPSFSCTAASSSSPFLPEASSSSRTRDSMK